MRSSSSPATTAPDSTPDSEHTRFFGDSTRDSRAVAAHALFSQGTRASGRLFLLVDEEHPETSGGSVHPVLATRYKWRTACAKARQALHNPACPSPVEPFLSAIQHRGSALPLSGKYDSVRPASSASPARPSPLAKPSTEVVCWLSAASAAITSRRGSANLHGVHAARPPTRRAASVIATPASPLALPSASAAPRRRSHDHVTGLCNARRTERNTLMRLSPPRSLDASLPAGSAPPVQHPLPGPLRCAKAHAPRVGRASTPLS
ncbi:hypothetical protein T484DRAFT_1798508 [Baffinella frigidus]|nr:hypothetical protein T484DRAFT_1798508 [Cryptophyta sp. CCMP2293]